MTLKKILASAVAAVMAVSSMAVFTSAAETYKAGVIFQTQDWNYRNDLDQDLIGVGGSLDEDEEYEGYEFNDVEITEDGTYTVSLTGLPETSALFNFVKLATSFPCTSDDDGNAVCDVTVEIKEVKIDGKAVSLDTSKILLENEKQHLTVSLMNEWNDVQKGNAAFENCVYSSDIEITFAVSGVGGGAANPDTGNASGDVDAPTDSDNKGNADTGVEGVAVVAGLAIIAAGAVVVAKKRK